MPNSARVAMLIDCDNISWRWAKQIVGEAALHGVLSVKRGYGDWTSTYLSGWLDELPRYAIQPVQQFAYAVGKNSTDSALIIDAMDLLYAGDVDIFCLVSSDSDFTRLAMRLRESGKAVYGIGAVKTPLAFQNACDRFTFIEVLLGKPVRRVDGSPVAVDEQAERPDTTQAEATGETPEGAGEEEVSADSVPDIKDVIVPAIEATSSDNGWAILSAVGSYIVNNNPSFDSRNYGYPRLGQLVRDLKFVTVKEIADDNGMSQIWVRLKASGKR
ncbi:MAG TPA: NYN domain-containing protein [Segeticoccus sp.]|uniref:NYN domain-containing protein n=1 Tax=Segeticoccus sp. TaxID=2706531 RepID=UPI002D7E2517|nr:NYN domain-containing protein [Segeticoccus sp.]HET8602176.1 NYN domain-containing protein [Segeticoccus sp.]